MTLNDTQKTWLDKHGLQLEAHKAGFNIEPKDWRDRLWGGRGFRHVSQWMDGKYRVVHTSIRGTGCMTGPYSVTVSEHTTLKAALRALVSR